MLRGRRFQAQPDCCAIVPARVLARYSGNPQASSGDRDYGHASGRNMALFQIAAHEAARAAAEPRSEAAATFAARTERATQDMLRRAWRSVIGRRSKSPARDGAAPGRDA